ncbi:hypothetical protein COPG_00098 [Colwellia phage 9A]|uniref:Uncharacterized protein n=1 Tax=Colwellia phage 9A TaxID=765765 RepID=I3UMH9_9CAUD|nr:hypothetical protein COPG_00098 [Colwellia phage 9A]AFK66694.1 hypothetical protein COPG_00098 [Colwellia phage 9A]
MSQTSSDNEEKAPKPVFKTDYEFCPTCERRMHNLLFDGHAACRSCRGLNSDGTEAAKYAKEKAPDVENT